MRCARCGLPEGELNGTECCAFVNDNGPGVIACRDREIANLHSLLRSVTGKLERAVEYLQTAQDESHQLHVIRSVAHAERVITSVLEALS